MKKLLSKATLGLRVFASREESRYVINDIYIEDGLAVATNGCMLAALVHKDEAVDTFPVVEADENESRRIPYKIAEQAIKSLPKKTTIPALANALFTGANLVTTDLASTNNQKITGSDGKFLTNWRQTVLTKQPVAAQVVLSAEHLRTICDYIIKHRSSRYVPPALRITIFEREADVPVVTRFDSAAIEGQPFTAWLMPMRDGTAIYPDPHEEPKGKVNEPEPVTAD